MLVHTLLACWAMSTAQSALVCGSSQVLSKRWSVSARRELPTAVSPQREEARHTWPKALVLFSDHPTYKPTAQMISASYRYFRRFAQIGSGSWMMKLVAHLIARTLEAFRTSSWSVRGGGWRKEDGSCSLNRNIS